MAIIADGQGIKVIKDTTDYVLKEVDSGYYYSHGVEAKNDFVIDTNKIHKVNGVLKLPLDNGKFVMFIDTITNPPWEGNHYYFYQGFNNILKNYQVGESAYEYGCWYLINIENGKIDTLFSPPIYSPSNLYYGYSFSNMIYEFRNVTFKNNNTNRKYKIEYEGVMTNGFKWIDDYSFLFYTYILPMNKFDKNSNKYYILEIKH